MVELISEIASNHGGSVGRAIVFIERFAKAGADTIKLQYTRAHRLAKSDPQREWFERVELSDYDFQDLRDYTTSLGKKFLLTVYHPDDVAVVRSLTDEVKVGSGEAHSGGLARAITGANFNRVLVSNGIRPPHQDYRNTGAKILACISRYPHPVTLVAAKLLETFSDGWSDHSVGLDGAMTAIALGAGIVEKHVQIREQSRAPQAFEATAEEFAELRRWADQNPERFLGRWNHGA